MIELLSNCPHGGDISNDCAGRVYSGKYHYDHEEEDCVLRKELEKDE